MKRSSGNQAETWSNQSEQRKTDAGADGWTSEWQGKRSGSCCERADWGNWLWRGVWLRTQHPFAHNPWTDPSGPGVVHLVSELVFTFILSGCNWFQLHPLLYYRVRSGFTPAPFLLPQKNHHPRCIPPGTALSDCPTARRKHTQYHSGETCNNGALRRWILTGNRRTNRRAKIFGMRSVKVFFIHRAFFQHGLYLGIPFTCA